MPSLRQVYNGLPNQMNYVIGLILKQICSYKVIKPDVCDCCCLPGARRKLSWLDPDNKETISIVVHGKVCAFLFLANEIYIYTGKPEILPGVIELPKPTAGESQSDTPGAL